MKKLFLVLVLSTLLFAQQGLPPEIPGEGTFWDFSVATVKSLLAPVEGGSGGYSEILNSTFYPAYEVFKVTTSHDTLPPFYGMPLNVFANDGTVGGAAAGQNPHITARIVDMSEVEGRTDLTLSIEFAALDSVLDFGQTVSFLITVRTMDALSSTGFFTASEEVYPLTYTHYDATGFVGARRQQVTVINTSYIYDNTVISISVNRDDRDTYPGSVGVVGYALSYWSKLADPDEEEGGGK